MKGNFRWVFTCIMIALFFFTGCAALKKPAPPTCAQVLRGEPAALGDEEISKVLDGAVLENRIDECWTPLVKQLLDRNRAIPMRHLVRAIRRFNTVGTIAWFHKAVYRYFSEMIVTGKAYRPEDRRLLSAYSRFVIREAASKSDPNLKNAEQICLRLDQDLFNRLFH
ncbi:MAG: hypothetical protein GXP53_06640 [Deltaproteobacteria bacterium]|nr:hypothetical protein [Deltaproteobacteria bacterium]